MKGWRNADAVLALAAGCLSLVAYLATLSPGAYPGESAALIVEYSGLFPRMSPTRPLWGALVWLIARIPLGGLAFRLNLFSALCGALSVWLVYQVTSGFIRLAITRTGILGIEGPSMVSPGSPLIPLAARLAGLAAAGFHAFSIPIWIVSTRIHPASFDLCLLLLAGYLLICYARAARPAFLYALCLVYAVGLVEFPTFIILAPLAGASMAVLAWRFEHVKRGRLAIAALCALAGFSLYFIAAWAFRATEGFELAGRPGYFATLLSVWLEQYRAVRGTMGWPGWLVVLFVTVVPWGAVLLAASDSLQDSRERPHLLLHIALTVLAAAILLTTPAWTWVVARYRRLLVTPYLMTAFVYGYLVAYWIPLRSGVNMQRGRLRWMVRRAGPAVGVGCLALLVVAPFRNLREADGRSSAELRRYAREVIECCEGCDWLITSGSLDDHLRIAARDMGSPLKFLNVRAGGSDAYMAYVTRQIRSPRLQPFAGVGVFPLLREWLKSDTRESARTAILSEPDLWLGAGFTVVPRKLVFLGRSRPEEVDIGRLLTEHEDFWRREVPPLAELRAGPPWRAEFRQDLLRHMSVVANNLGVLAQDMEKPGEAFEAYAWARQICPDNVSALLNQEAMIEGGFATDQAQAVTNAFRSLGENVEGRANIWKLSRQYGYVRSPAAFARLGMLWALSGQPGMAASGLRKAMAMLPEGDRGDIRERLATLYLWGGQVDKGEEEFGRVLEEDPRNAAALLGLARIAAGDGAFDRARGLLERAEEAGVPMERLSVEWASMHILAGESERARIILEEAVALKPDFVEAWTLLVPVLIAMKDEAALGTCIQRIRELDGEQGFFVQVAGARRAAAGENWDEVTAFIDRAVTFRPGDPWLLQWGLRVDLVRGRKADARKRTRQLLDADPDHPFGNLVMASFAAEDGDYRLAENLLRRALEGDRMPLALNNLAWILQADGNYEEAEQHVRSALAIDGGLYQAWDTLGEILMKTDRLSEAEQAVLRSLAIVPATPEVSLHLAEIHFKLGRTDSAREMLPNLVAKRPALSALGQQRLDELLRTIGQE